MKRRAIAFILITLLILPQGVWGASESDQLEIVIKAVKTKITVPDTLAKFSYRLNGTTYDLEWRDDDTGETIRIDAKINGDILGYYLYKNSKDNRLASVKKEVAEQTARNFLKQTVPKYERFLELEGQNTPSQYNEYTFNYNLVKEGVKVFCESVSIDVDKQTGEVRNFRGIDYDGEATYGVSKPTLTKEQAEANYLKQIGLRLSYHISKNYDKDEQSSFLVYNVANNEMLGISAVDGKVVSLVKEDVNKYSRRGYLQEYANTQDIATGGLTPAEQKAVDETSGLLTQKAIKEKWENTFTLIKQMTIINQYVYKEKEDYYRSMTLSSTSKEEKDQARLRVNAKTGELIDYSYPRYRGKYEKTKNPDCTDEKMLKFITKVAPAEAGHVKLKGKSPINVNDDGRYTQQSFDYQRFENDIEVENDGMNCTYDKIDQEVVSYDKRWTKTTFKDPKGILTEKEAIKGVGLELFYMRSAPHHYELVYNHEESRQLLDAFSGKTVDYSGNEVKRTSVSQYSDIAGHPQEAMIISLYNSGIYLNENILKPDTPITQKEFLDLLIQIKHRSHYENEKAIYEAVVSSGIITEKEKNPSQIVTKEQGINYMVNATQYKKVAALSSIYVYPFKDEDVNKECIGSIAIAKGLGWIKETEYLKPKTELTKAQAMTYMYYFLRDMDQDL